MALKLKVGAVQEGNDWLGQHVQDSVQIHSEIRCQTDENLLNDCIRNLEGKCTQRKQKYAEYAEYAEYAKNTQNA